ncbi:uncharacterized protein BKA78DRAFT_123361 [Phyllosticta capitalensis]|uniref:uncharacterized protein n=1 Tax=Phyllosticta capitalensis TaxID=121624 RepID=UPI00312F8F7D
MILVHCQQVLCRLQEIAMPFKSPKRIGQEQARVERRVGRCGANFEKAEADGKGGYSSRSAATGQCAKAQTTLQAALMLDESCSHQHSLHSTCGHVERLLRSRQQGTASNLLYFSQRLSANYKTPGLDKLKRMDRTNAQTRLFLCSLVIGR